MASGVSFIKMDDIKEELNKKPANDSDILESVLSHVGEMGLYQKLLFIGMLPFGFFFAFVYFGQMFITVAPQNYWCRIPELIAANLSLEVRRNLSAPGAASGIWDHCMTLDANWSQVLENMEPPPDGTPLVPCQYGWEFEFTDIPYETVVTERGWVCEYASIAPTAQAVFFAGSFVGGFVLGWVADTFGRVPALMGASLIGAIGGIATIFTKDVIDFIFCRFLVGMAFDNVFMMMYILVLEYVGPSHRTWVANMSIALFFGAGCISLPWLALWLSDWRLLLWVTSLPMLIVLFAPLVVPESARWLVSRGRVNRAVKVLKKFEKVNGTKIPDDVMQEFIMTSNQKRESRESFTSVIKSPLLRRTMILMIIVYMGCSIIFDGLVRLSDAFGLDFFITFTFTSATEVPSITLLAIILDRFGRRKLACIPMTLSGILVLIAMFVPKGLPQASLAIMARFCINMSYNTLFQWVTELLPTAGRASGSSAMHMSGYIATILSPFIVYSERVWALLPLLTLGVVALISASIGIILPETKGQPMPQTMADGEKIVREQSLCGKPEDEDDE
ncbi:solute carrier family 22 member 3-like [Anticarsia gemmatalis]|uniref:solute carrier family 22 member 3-like n=1 Tax=Anticarsia gemmatalis TaxID=129554 RepID=UPI003F760BEB